MRDFSRCNYRAAQLKHTVTYGSARTGDCLNVAIKKSQLFHFKGDTIVAIRLLVQIKHTEINGCACTGDFRLIFSLWKQRRPRPKNLLLLWRSKRCIIVQYWFRKLVVVLCTGVCWKNTARRVWKRDCGEKCARQSFVNEFSQLDFSEKRKGSSVVDFNIFNTTAQVTLICWKIQRCLTWQRKLTLAESCNFLVVVNTGKYFFRVW